MSFYKIYNDYKNFKFISFFNNITTSEVENSLQKEKFNEQDILTLLSNNGCKFLEEMARSSNKITKQYFGNTIQLYTPLYLSNFCSNNCIYCGFKSSNKIKRKKLNISELEHEAKFISQKGIQHILILTGESRENSSVSYIKECIEALKKYFSSISIEIYPLKTKEYEILNNTGIDGVTIYQETYNEKRYSELHQAGEKNNFLYRLETPERACDAKIRSINIGALLGLYDWRIEIFFLILHARYLQNKYPDREISISLPRLQNAIGEYKSKYIINNTDFVQALLISRLSNPKIGITISTREKSTFRDNLIELGITKMSAGSKTEVGGYTFNNKTEKQFEISDNRSVNEIKNIIYQKGYQPVFKDWHIL